MEKLTKEKRLTRQKTVFIASSKEFICQLDQSYVLIVSIYINIINHLGIETTLTPSTKIEIEYID